MPTRKYTTLPYTEYTVADGHFDTNRAPITKIVLHSSAGNRQSLLNVFSGNTTPERFVSSHYGIDNDGSILAFLEEYYTAYHAGLYAVNECSIGIEHIDNGSDIQLHTNSQYETSAKLVADICNFYSIPIDSIHVVPHSSIVSTSCPNGLDVNRIIEGAKKIQEVMNISTPVITDQTKILIGTRPDNTLWGDNGSMEVQAIRSVMNDEWQSIKGLTKQRDDLQKQLSDATGPNLIDISTLPWLLRKIVAYGVSVSSVNGKT